MDKVYEELKNNIGYRNEIAIGVSGGPDSMALLDIMMKLKKELDLVLVVCHVNHNVRKESKDEAAYLKDFCKRECLHYEYKKIDSYSDDNFHNEARTIRYEFFDKVVKEYNAKYLLTAHHGDDLMETILMRIVRGSTLKGYSGFSKSLQKDGYTILRPLITVTKQELKEYCEKNKINYFVDASNEKEVYTRNRYRHHLLPFLKEEDKNVHEKFLKFSETLLEYNDYIDKEVNKVFNMVFEDTTLYLEKFKELDHLIQTKIINNVLEKIYSDDLLIITNTHVNLIFDLINSDKPNSMVHLPNNVKATKTYNELTFSYIDDINESYEIEISNIVNLPNGKIIEKIDSTIDNSNNIIKLNSKDIKLPLYVRTRKNGDKIVLKGMNLHKKVNDIFIDSKISIKERNIWPIVCDSQENIVWIPGLKKSKFDVEKNSKYDIILKYY